MFTYKRTEEGLEEVAQYKTKAGSGPRHLAFPSNTSNRLSDLRTRCNCRSSFTIKRTELLQT